MPSPQSHSAEYTARINRAVDYIEAHLSEPLDLAQIAEVACFSRYHFHRIFHAAAGETLGRFITRLRLERAAGRLIRCPHEPITSVALDSGFSSSATFARAFKGHFGVSASAWREGQRNPGQLERNSGMTLRNPREAYRVRLDYGHDSTMGVRWRVEMSEQMKLSVEVEVKEMPAYEAVYLRHTGPYKGDVALFGRLWGQLMGWAAPRGLFRPPETQMITVYHDDPKITEDEKLRLSVCLTVPEGTEVSGEIGRMSIAGGAYATARFELSAEQIEDAWAAIYAGWLPQSGYQPEDSPPYDVCLGNPDEHPEGLHTFAIYVPVKPL